MVFLPILFWSGQTELGRGSVHILASGVFFSGFIKDLLCLPRPLSPPLQRITMSGSAALEYGFPSTHSTNAVSVAVYVLTLLNSPDLTLSPTVNLICQGIAYLYVTSIVIGRLYCGMHGFFDVVIGCVLGALITLVQYSLGPAFDNYVVSGSAMQLGFVVMVILGLVRIHPEPADDCPCFDDSVAFAGVMIGAQVAYWHFARTSVAWSEPSPSTIPYRYESLGLSKTAMRIILGVVLIFAWREIMKPTLLRILPPVFRGLEKLGLILPRRFFTNASQYSEVPTQLKDHEVLPKFSEIPSIITNIRNPRRRAISVGPQSEADAYETLAYREKRRRESLSTGARGSSAVDVQGSPAPDSLQPKLSKLNEYENMMGTGSQRYNPRLGMDSSDIYARLSPEPFPEYVEPDEKEMFSKIKRPRVRYDVEVVTKLIVYSGIAWLVIEGAPILFELVGLGVPN
ncbi:hypothetical protein AWENTII_007776 [Aspergillus wentii]